MKLGLKSGKKYVLSKKEYKDFLALVRLGLGHENDMSPWVKGNTFEPVNWKFVKELADRQGLTAIVLDGIEQQKTNYADSTNIIDQEFLLQWIEDVILDYEMQYEVHKKAIAELTKFYNSHGFKMMILKGYACSLDWPKPEHRPCGDIDIWLFGRQQEADDVLSKKKRIEIDRSHHHHTVFYWKDIMVENHYDFVNVHHHNSNKAMERLMKELAYEDSHYVELEGSRIYFPSYNFHAFFLLRHTMNHFAASEISLRQLLDWAFFIEKHGKDVDWDRMMKEMEYYKMTEMFNVFNAICVEDLGFNARIFPCVQFNEELRECVFEDILNPAFVTAEPKLLVKRLFYKLRRWQGNAWKQNLCYPDSRWSGFWNGVWSHLLKPSSI